MAFVLAVIILGNIGISTPTVAQVEDGYGAQTAGLQAGDEIIKMNHKHIHFFKEISMYTLFHAGETVEVTYERNGERHIVEVQPTYDEEQGRYRYGIDGSGEYTKVGPIKTLQYSVYEVKYWIQYTVGSLKMLLTRQVSVNDLSGPVGIVKTIGDTYDMSKSDGAFYVWMNLLNLALLLSANLGVMNLLPIPALDGGRLVFLVIEAIRGKRVSEDKEGMVHFIGLLCLFGLMILIMFNDIRKLIP
jgi:regulator of sigma E protease